MDTQRLGALLPEVGKIGVPGVWTPAEFEAITIHPSAGARILRSIPFLAPQLPIDLSAFQWARRRRTA